MSVRTIGLPHAGNDRTSHPMRIDFAEEPLVIAVNEQPPSAKPEPKYRSRFSIYVDIIEHIQHEGRRAKPTRMMLDDTNLSRDRLIKYLGELKALEVIQESDRGTYNLTQKGIEFMNSFGEVEAFLQAFGFKL